MDFIPVFFKVIIMIPIDSTIGKYNTKKLTKQSELLLPLIKVEFELVDRVTKMEKKMFAFAFIFSWKQSRSYQCRLTVVWGRGYRNFCVDLDHAFSAFLKFREWFWPNGSRRHIGLHFELLAQTITKTNCLIFESQLQSKRRKLFKPIDNIYLLTQNKHFFVVFFIS